MRVKALYGKEVEIIDEITQDEIDSIDDRGMPLRFDGMADQIDNIKPLTFIKWSYYDEKEDANASIYEAIRDAEEYDEYCKKHDKSIILFFIILLIASFIGGFLLSNCIKDNTSIKDNTNKQCSCCQNCNN